MPSPRVTEFVRAATFSGSGDLSKIIHQSNNYEIRLPYYPRIFCYNDNGHNSPTPTSAGFVRFTFLFDSRQKDRQPFAFLRPIAKVAQLLVGL